MRRIDTSTRSVDLFGTGKDGFKDGNVGLGIAATAFNAAWCNSVQEELANAIESAGLVLNGADNTQLAQAIALAAPAGTVIYFAAPTAPTGYLKADGTSLSTTAYADLFSVIGYTFGGSGGSFLLPDLRGEFLRGWADGRGVDSGRVFGSYQADAFKSHSHAVPSVDIINPTLAFIYNDGSGDSIASADNANANVGQVRLDRYYTANTGGTETRPRNIALLACIKH